jgi:hypothetical protein
VVSCLSRCSLTPSQFPASIYLRVASRSWIRLSCNEEQCLLQSRLALCKFFPAAPFGVAPPSADLNRSPTELHADHAHQFSSSKPLSLQYLFGSSNRSPTPSVLPMRNATPYRAMSFLLWKRQNCQEQSWPPNSRITLSPPECSSAHEVQS